MESLGQRIRFARKRAGFNQVALAQAVGCRQSTISELETGESHAPSGPVLQRLAEVLGVSERWILYGEDGELQVPTEQEQELLSAFRNLSEAQREAIYATIKALSNKG